MKVEFRASFARDLRKLRNEEARAKARQLIGLIEESPGLDAVPGIRRLQSPGEYYRIGLAMADGVVVFIRFLHRRDIYRYFP